MEDDQMKISCGSKRPRSAEFDLHWSEWQLLDSILPTGGFAHSFGIEAAVQARIISSPDDLRTHVIHVLENTGSLLLPFVYSATVSPTLETWHKLDKMLDATLTNEKSHLSKGMREISLCSGTFTFHHAPVFGIICGLLGLQSEISQKAYMFVTTRDAISAATRLNLVGPLGAAVLQHQIGFVAEAMLKKWKDRPVEEACQTAPLLDTVQGCHGYLFSRLFSS
ncbi:hypothetical protein Patl1_22906 [Pistacia atlantica]|uniref:Uncharacterized protein n=1 Tax=Pistacia atlantica TaxID=434234 RepID=A0ACC1A0H2_9ROSI|nr:hypothetical protein Patl1_22906 [Pistacia atlantica]